MSRSFYHIIFSRLGVLVFFMNLPERKKEKTMNRSFHYLFRIGSCKSPYLLRALVKHLNLLVERFVISLVQLMQIYVLEGLDKTLIPRKDLKKKTKRFNK